MIKLDIEGAEYSVLMSIDSDIAKQISIEFHDFIDPDLKDKTDEYVQKIIDLGYNLHFSSKWTGRFGTDYMDCLFIRK